MSKEKSVRIRGGHRAYVSKIIENVNENLAEFDGSISEREKLESLKVTLQEKKGVLKGIDDTILETTKDEDIDKEIIEASEIGEFINRTCVKITNALSPSNPASLSLSNSESMQASSSINTLHQPLKPSYRS